MVWKQSQSHGTAARAAPAATGASSLGTFVALTKKPSGVAAPTQHHPSHTAAEEQQEASHRATAQPQHPATLRGRSPLISLQASQVYVPVPRSLITQNSPTRERSLSHTAETLSTAPSSEEAAAPAGCLGAASSCFRGKQMVGETAARHRHQASTRAPKGGTRKICLGYGTAQQHTCSKTFLRIDLPPLSHVPSLSLRTSSPAPPALGRSGAPITTTKTALTERQDPALRPVSAPQRFALGTSFRVSLVLVYNCF